MIQIDKAKCTKCQQCTEVCFLGILTGDNENIPTINNTENCFDCGHCIAVCSQDAITHSNVKSIGQTSPASLGMASYLMSRRSCRHFKNRQLDKAVLEQMLQVTTYAPTTFNSQERSVIVISDKHILNSLKRSLVKPTRTGISVMKIMSSKLMKLFTSKEAQAYFSRAILDLQITLEKFNKGEDAFFHDAPHLVLFCGVKNDPFGKDHALGAMYYFMDVAQQNGFGTCINGHIQNAHSLIRKHVALPKDYRVFGALTVGYPKKIYKNMISRKAASILWS